MILVTLFVLLKSNLDVQQTRLRRGRFRRLMGWSGYIPFLRLIVATFMSPPVKPEVVNPHFLTLLGSQGSLTKEDDGSVHLTSFKIRSFTH